jgi:dihydrofolate reductase
VNVFLIAAVSVDGKIAPEASTNSGTWTSGADKQFFSERTKKARVMVMGSNTFATIGRPMKDRLTIVMSSKPKPAEYQQFNDSQVRYTSQSPEEIVAQLESEGFIELALCGGSNVYSQFMTRGLVSTLYITIEPIVFGQGIPLFKESDINQKLTLKEVTKIGPDTVLLEYSVIQN